MLQATDLEELVDLSMVLSRGGAANGSRVGVVSTSGGAGVWLADACTDRGLDLPDFDEALGAADHRGGAHSPSSGEPARPHRPRDP